MRINPGSGDFCCNNTSRIQTNPQKPIKRTLRDHLRPDFSQKGFVASLGEPRTRSEQRCISTGVLYLLWCKWKSVPTEAKRRPGRPTPFSLVFPSFPNSSLGTHSRETPFRALAEITLPGGARNRVSRTCVSKQSLGTSRDARKKALP